MKGTEQLNELNSVTITKSYEIVLLACEKIKKMNYTVCTIQQWCALCYTNIRSRCSRFCGCAAIDTINTGGAFVKPLMCCLEARHPNPLHHGQKSGQPLVNSRLFQFLELNRISPNLNLCILRTTANETP